MFSVKQALGLTAILAVWIAAIRIDSPWFFELVHVMALGSFACAALLAWVMETEKKVGLGTYAAVGLMLTLFIDEPFEQTAKHILSLLPDALQGTNLRYIDMFDSNLPTGISQDSAFPPGFQLGGSYPLEDEARRGRLQSGLVFVFAFLSAIGNVWVFRSQWGVASADPATSKHDRQTHDRQTLG